MHRNVTLVWWLSPEERNIGLDVVLVWHLQAHLVFAWCFHQARQVLRWADGWGPCGYSGNDIEIVVELDALDCGCI